MEPTQNQPCPHFMSIKAHKMVAGTLVMFLFFVLLCLSFYLISLSRNSFTAHDYIGKSPNMQNSISIAGEGTVASIPDIAKVSVGLTTEKKTVAEAQKENTDKMNQIISALKDLGIAEKDLKTENYNIYPKNEWKDGRSNLVGYTVSQNLNVKIRDTKKVSDVLKVTAEKGANQVGSLSFDIDNPESLQNQAREKAIDNAKVKARELADQLGVKLGKVISFSESNVGGEVPYYKSLDSAMGGATAEMMPTIQTGENEIKSNVYITYEIL